MALHYKENLWGRFAVVEESTGRRLGFIFRNAEHTAYKFYPDSIDALDEATAFAVYKELQRLNGPDYVA